MTRCRGLRFFDLLHGGLDGFGEFENFVELGDSEAFHEGVSDPAENDSAFGGLNGLMDLDEDSQRRRGHEFDVGEIDDESATAHFVHDSVEFIVDQFDGEVVQKRRGGEFDDGDVTDAIQLNGCFIHGISSSIAQDRNRTCTPLRVPAPQAGASANSATWARTDGTGTNRYRIHAISRGADLQSESSFGGQTHVWFEFGSAFGASRLRQPAQQVVASQTINPFHRFELSEQQ